MPGGGATPALVPGVSAPGGLPLSGLLRGVGDEPELTDFDERGQEVRIRPIMSIPTNRMSVAPTTEKAPTRTPGWASQNRHRRLRRP